MSNKRVVVVDGNLKDYAGQHLERGEIFSLRDQLHDNRLLGQNAINHPYVRELETHEQVWKCLADGREFLGDVTGQYARAHLAKWRHDAEAIDMDGPQLKTGHKPRHEGGRSDPDRGEAWDLENSPEDAGLAEATQDPYEGEREGSKERPKRVSLA